MGAFNSKTKSAQHCDWHFSKNNYSYMSQSRGEHVNVVRKVFVLPLVCDSLTSSQTKVNMLPKMILSHLKLSERAKDKEKTRHSNMKRINKQCRCCYRGKINDILITVVPRNDFHIRINFHQIKWLFERFLFKWKFSQLSRAVRMAMVVFKWCGNSFEMTTNCNWWSINFIVNFLFACELACKCSECCMWFNRDTSITAA